MAVRGKSISIESTLQLVLADYEVAFENGSSSINRAKRLRIKMESEYARN
jgi:hypothetical protein